MAKDIESDLIAMCSIMKGKFLTNPSLLTQGKLSFAGKIKSNRKMEKVQNIDDLLQLLRRNGLLKPDSFDTLLVFKNLLQDDSFDKALAEHSNLQNLSNANCRNIYAAHRSYQYTNETPQADNQPRNLIPGGKREKMFRILANGVSPSGGISQSEFLSLARVLKFSENDISDFVKRINSNSARTMIMFGRFEERKGELSVDLVLRLLDLIKRHDLAEHIKKL